MEAVAPRSVAVIQAIGIAATLVYGVAIAWVYVTQPRTLAELKNAAAVQANVYTVDDARFALGLKAFRDRQYRIAINQFAAADPANRDPKTQFLIASSHYALGKGRVYDDDDEFAAALVAVDRCLQATPNGSYTIDDASLGLEYTSAEALRERLRQGLEVTPGDFNPFASGTGAAP